MSELHQIQTRKERMMTETLEGIRQITAGEAPAHWMGGEAMVTTLASSEQTAGQYSLFEVRDDPRSGPPMHVHHREDEAYYILEGEYEIHAPGQPVLRAGPGTNIHVARDTVHTYRCAGPGRGRMLVIASPGGLETFFAELGVLAMDREHAPAPSGPPDFARVAAIANSHGIEVVGPPPM